MEKWNVCDFFQKFFDIADDMNLTPICWTVLKGRRLCLHHLVYKGANFFHPDFTHDKYPMLFPLASELIKLIDSKKFSDLKLKVEGKTIFAHKVMVSRCLKKLVMDNNQIQEIEITNMSYESLIDFLKYLYAGVIPNEESKVKNLLIVANEYGLPFLRQTCENELMGGKTKNLTMKASTIPAHLAGVLDRNLFSDCVIFVEGTSFKLHRFILSARSSYFATIFQNEDVSQIHLDGISKTIFRALMDYIYTDTLRRLDAMLNDELVQLFESAQKYDVQNLMLKCEFYFFERISDETVTEIYLATESHSMPRLKKACLNFIASGLKGMKKKGNSLRGSSSKANGITSSLSNEHINEVKKHLKESKKLREAEEKLKKKGKNFKINKK